jgi:hypothetical protein
MQQSHHQAINKTKKQKTKAKTKQNQPTSMMHLVFTHLRVLVRVLRRLFVLGVLLNELGVDLSPFLRWWWDMFPGVYHMVHAVLLTELRVDLSLVVYQHLPVLVCA